MTRLKTSDIEDISTRLTDHDSALKTMTGRSLLGIGCHAWGLDEARCIQRQQNFTIHVIPVTAGLGTISQFSETVCAILTHMGFNAEVSPFTDTTGIAAAFESGADGIMMSDDDRFVGINLHTRRVADNSESTGRVFAAALELMAGGLEEKPALVMGCGPVGRAAAERLMECNAQTTLYDRDTARAGALQTTLSRNGKSPATVTVEKDLTAALAGHQYIVEATPSSNTVPEAALTRETMIAAPGVPLGISLKGREQLRNRLIHDHLELGVAAMAALLIAD